MKKPQDVKHSPTPVSIARSESESEAAQEESKKRPDGKSDPRETAQESVHQVMPKEEAAELTERSPTPPAPREAPHSAAGAAKGDDDIMSQPPKRK